MSFAKNVNKYYKWVLGSIVGIMALSLVVSGNMNMGGEDPDRVHARIFGGVDVTEREWREAFAKSGAWFRLKAVRDIDHGTDYRMTQLQPYLFSFRDGPGLLAFHEPFKPSQEDHVAAAKELIILGYDAKAKNVRATEEEVDDIIRGFLERARVPADDGDAQAKFARDYFLAATPEAFRGAVRDSILIERALSLEVGGCNTRYEDLFNEKLSSSRSVRVLAAGIDGSKLPGDLAPVTDDDIRARFDSDRESYKMPAKVQIEYLTAHFDDFKSRLKEPTPEEIQKYYDEKKSEFVKKPSLDEGHSEDDGHDHGTPPQREQKPLADVREEIIKKIKDQQAFKQAWDTLYAINSKDFAARWYKLLEEEQAREPKDAKAVQERVRAKTGGILAEIRDEYRKQGITLRNGITLPFDKNGRAPFTDELGTFIGTGADPSSDWAFEGPEGEVAHQIYRSEKGVSLIRIAKKMESYATDLTGPIREKIREDLLRDRTGERARRLADELVSKIKSGGAAELARLKSRTDLKIQRSTYVSDSTPDAEAGLVPNTLAQQVKEKFLKAPENPVPGAPAEIADVQAIHGDMLGGDRKDWSYVVIVEDSVQKSPEVKDEDFFGEVRRRELEEVAKARVKQAEKLVANAEWKDAAPAAAE
jgi:hypothetical protein